MSRWSFTFYRGRNPLNWALINGESKFGITVHYVDEGIDTGDIVEQRLYSITQEDNYQTLLDKAINECANVLFSAILKFHKVILKLLSKRYSPCWNLFWNKNHW
ncbi:formyltransferase family protein [Vibrio taketomensis]|uniref:formyltransferase family protein n=1 Tax=Vibrio taketomensis TaxID=2572923 RepID=UPI0018DA29BB